MKRNKKISLFISGLSTVMAGVSLYNLVFIANTQNEVIGALTTFCLCIMMSCVGLWDYEYLSKKK